jgi:hypothetical protein
VPASGRPRIMATKRASVVASGLLARPGGAPVRSTPLEDLPRPAPAQIPSEPVQMPPVPVQPAARAEAPLPEEAGAKENAAKGIKHATIGTTVYLLPAEHKRVRRLALDLDVPSVHELLLMGLDRLLAEKGESPVVRYSQPRPKKG